jgi:hypothetical protein
MADVLDGTLDPSPVFDLTVGLDGIPDGHAAMDERRALKVLIRIREEKERRRCGIVNSERAASRSPAWGTAAWD